MDHTISFTHFSEKERAQIFVQVFGDRDIIYSLQHKQPFLMFIISSYKTYLSNKYATKRPVA